MNQHVGAIGILWIAAGLWLIGLSARGLTTESWFESVVTSWLITLGFGALAIVAAIAFWRRGIVGRVLIRAVSILALIYSAAWLLLGGIEDAGNYWPWILFSSALAAYGLWAAKRVARAV